MKDFIVTVCLILFITVFIILVGTAGGIERDAILMSDGVKNIIIEVLILIVLAVVIALLSREEKDVTDLTRL